MVTRIEIASKVFDARAEVRRQRLENLGFAKKIKDLFLVDVYTINKKFNRSELVKIVSMLSNPVSQQATFRYQPLKKFSWVIEVGYLPGVTDNVANTTKESIEDLLKIKFGLNEGVYTSQITFIVGNFSIKEVTQIAENMINPLIQRVHVKSSTQFWQNKGMDVVVPRVRLNKKPTVDVVDLDVDDEALQIIGKQGIANKDGTRRGPLALDTPRSIHTPGVC